MVIRRWLASARPLLPSVVRGWGLAVAASQFVNGTIELALTPHYAALEARMHVGPAAWGTALGAFPVGLLVGAPIGGWIAHRWGSRWAMVLGAVLFFVVPALTGLAPSLPWFAAVLFCAAVANGIYDVAYGMQATEFERAHAGDPFLAHANLGFQALFSFGSVAGALSAALALWAGWATFPHMLGVGVAAVLAVGLTAGGLPARPEGRRTQRPRPRRARGLTQLATETWERCATLWRVPWWHLTRERLTLAGLCTAGCVGFFPLGASYAWSTPYLVHLGARPWVGTLGAIAYGLSEGTGRLAAWRSRYLRDLPKRRIVVGGSVLALLGAVLIVGPGTLVVAIVGFGLIALGFSPTGPILQSAVSRTGPPDSLALRMTLFTGAGYLGSVLGQPVIGWVTAVSSLRVALSLLIVCAVVVLALSRAVRDVPLAEADEV